MVNVILKQAILWFVTLFLFLAILFLPRNVEYETGEGGMFVSAKYEYTVKEHLNQFKQFYLTFKENKGLGEVMGGYSLTEHIMRTFTKSLAITIPGLFLGFFIGVAKGILDYRTRLSRGKLLTKGSTWLFLSTPDLFFIIFIQIALMKMYAAGYIPHVDVYGSDQIDNYILGILFLSIYPIFYIANITYRSIRDEEGMDYIRTAFAKGTSSLKVLYTHVLRNCWLKILSHSNTIILYVLSNLFIIEYLTNFRGGAYFFFQSVAATTVFFVGQEFSISLSAAAGYTILSTIIDDIPDTYWIPFSVIGVVGITILSLNMLADGMQKYFEKKYRTFRADL